MLVKTNKEEVFIMIDVVIVVLAIAAVVGVVFNQVKKAKKGETSCGHDCGGCGSDCKH